MNPVVRSENELSPEWFNATLAGKLLQGRCVTRVHTEAIGAGQMGRIVKARLQLDGDAAALSVIVKMASADPDSLRMCVALGIYEPEVRFYEELARSVSMPVPACHHAALDSESGHFTLVLEDLSTTMRPGDVLSGGTVQQAELAIEALVGLQAPFWNSAELRGSAWLDHQRTLRLFDMLPDGLDSFLRRFGGGLTSEQQELINDVLPRAGQWARAWSGPWVPIHGDYRLDNMMFAVSSDARPLVVIDWQTLRLGPPLLDAAYYLGACLPTSERRRHERTLIAGYHSRLVAQGITGFDFDACWENYRRYSLYGALMIAGIVGGIEQTERGDAMLLQTIRRYIDLALDLQASGFA